MVNEGNEDGMQRQVVGQVFKPRRQQQHTAFAFLLVEQKRSAVAETRGYTRLARIHQRGVEDSGFRPASVVTSRLRLLQSRMRKIHLANGCRTARACVVTDARYTPTPDWDSRMA